MIGAAVGAAAALEGRILSNLFLRVRNHQGPTDERGRKNARKNNAFTVPFSINNNFAGAVLTAVKF